MSQSDEHSPNPDISIHYLAIPWCAPTRQSSLLRLLESIHSSTAAISKSIKNGHIIKQQPTGRSCCCHPRSRRKGRVRASEVEPRSRFVFIWPLKVRVLLHAPYPQMPQMPKSPRQHAQVDLRSSPPRAHLISKDGTIISNAHVLTSGLTKDNGPSRVDTLSMVKTSRNVPSGKPWRRRDWRSRAERLFMSPMPYSRISESTMSPSLSSARCLTQVHSPR